jgi:glutaredoxin
MNAALQITLIGRQGCHLCEDAQTVLAGVIARFASENPLVEYVIEDIDVDSDLELRDKYSDEVPVLLVNGQQIAFLRFDGERISEKLVEYAKH